jgi:signal transduction histidine kinase
MRFNDFLRTVLANMGDGTVATVTRWRQCIDLLAQYDVSGAANANALDDEDREAVLLELEVMRPQLTVAQRVASVVELGGRLRSPGLVRLLARDHPTLVVAMLASVTLADDDWVAIIPDLGPLARSVLRRRGDLGRGAVAALQRFGSVDLSLTSLVPPDTEGDICETAGEPANDRDGAHIQSQIGRIMAQIERFTETRQQRGDSAPAAEQAPPRPGSERRGPANEQPPSPIRRFTFETDEAGVIQSVAGAPRAAAMGLSIGHVASDSRHGADGLALGAFRRRAAFEKARFTIGAGMLAGAWRISGTPRFDRATGRFLNYIGSARRERPDEALVKASREPAGWGGLSAAGTRELVHELRTPLNAIHGYAEMIEAELVGPVSSEYRDMARQILTDARTLVETFDDLDLASRIERGDEHGAPERIDLAALMQGIAGAFEQDRRARRIDITADRDLAMIGCDRLQLERMLGHLIRAGYGALTDGERLAIRLAPGVAPQSVEIMMRRPMALCNLPEDVLLDHGDQLDRTLSPAPPLGLAFTLKLVRGIAAHLGGYLEMTPHSSPLNLRVPAATPGKQGSVP